MFKLLRSKAKIFYWVIAISFILFIFLAWGMDITGGGGRGQGSGRSDVIGSVNGRPISTREWDETYQSYIARMRQQNPDQPLTANMRAQANEQVWQAFLRDRVEQAEIDRLRLTSTPEEILDILKHNPPPELLAQYRTESGQPDMNAYLADLANPNRDWRGVETYLLNQLPRQKLQQMIAAQAVVSDAELREAWLRQSARAVAEYVGVLLTDVPVETEPTPEELEAVYREHLGRYQQPARVKLKAVTWPKEPSETDRAEVRALAQEIKQEIESGQSTFEEAAAIYSQDPSKDNGGDLGTFDRNRMVAPFSAAAFSLPVGQLSEPVESQFGYHLIEVLEQFHENGVLNQVHARHILLKIEPGEGTLSDLYARAEDFLTRAAKRGLAAVAAEDSLTVMSPDALPEGRDIPGLPNSQLAVQFAFAAKPGERSRVLENDDVYYVVELESRLPAGPAPLDEVRSQVANEVKQRKQKELAKQRLAPAVAAIQAGTAMSDAAARFGLTHAVTDTFTATANITKVGFGTAFNTVALEVPAGTLVPSVETPRGVFALRTLWKSPLNEADFAAQKEMLRMQLLSRKQREIVEAWYAERVAEAQIVDNREALLRGGA